MTDVAHILGEFIAAWNAGQRPRMAAYLERVPPAERDDLADQIETFLMVAPEPEYSVEDWAEMTADPMVARVAEAAFAPAEAEPWPSLLPRLRERAGVSWGQVAERLGFRDRERATDLLEQMERGELDPRRPTWSLLDRLAKVLGVSPQSLDWRGGLSRPAAPAALGALRADDPDTEAREQLDTAAEMFLEDDREPDEVEREFLGGRE
jgi:transcriptional regulator with XRE-family HTH domain